MKTESLHNENFVNTPAVQEEVNALKNLVKSVNVLAAKLKEVDVILTSEILNEFSTDEHCIQDLLLKQLKEKDPQQYELFQSVYFNSTHQRVQALNLFPIHTELNRCIHEAHIGPHQVTIENGKAVFTEKEEAQIVAKHTTCLREEDRELYDLTQDLVKAYDALQTYIHSKEPETDLGEILRNGLNSFSVDSRGEIHNGNLIICQVIDEEHRTQLITNPLFFQ